MGRNACVLAWMVAAATLAHAAPVPVALQVQGILRDGQGQFESGSVGLVFRLYDAPTGGTPLLDQAYAEVPVEGGVFTVTLGAGSGVGTPLDPGLFVDHAQLWLGITASGDPAELPRIPLTTVPFSFQADHANRCDVASAVPPGAVGMAGLSTAGCSAGQVLRVDAAGWACGADQDTTYQAGTGLTLDGGVLAIATGAVTHELLAADSVHADNLADGTVGTAELSSAVYAGSGTRFGTAATVARSDHVHPPACPVGMVTYTSQGNVLCVGGETTARAWAAAADACWTTWGAHLCTATELRVACTAGFTLAVDRWMADRSGDNLALFTNSAGCGDFDGEINVFIGGAGATVPLKGAYCCLRKPAY